MNRERPRRERSRRDPLLHQPAARISTPPPRPRCRHCGKVAFPSLAQAEYALMETKLRRALRPHNSGNRREERAYPCPHGGGVYHLTSAPDQRRTA